jgi:hypothetical protein
MDPSGAGNRRGPATPVGTSHGKASTHGAIQVHVSSRHEATAHHVSSLSFCDVGREIWTGIRATEVRSDSRLRPRASWDHHYSTRCLTVREARAPEECGGTRAAAQHLRLAIPRRQRTSFVIRESPPLARQRPAIELSYTLERSNQPAGNHRTSIRRPVAAESPARRASAPFTFRPDSPLFP